MFYGVIVNGVYYTPLAACMSLVQLGPGVDGEKRDHEKTAAARITDAIRRGRAVVILLLGDTSHTHSEVIAINEGRFREALASKMELVVYRTPEVPLHASITHPACLPLVRAMQIPYDEFPRAFVATRGVANDLIVHDIRGYHPNFTEVVQRYL